MDLTLDNDAAHSERMLIDAISEIGYGIALRECFYNKNGSVNAETIKCGHLNGKYPFCITSNLTLGTVGVVMTGQGGEKVMLAETKLAFIDLVTNEQNSSFLINFMVELQRTFDNAQAAAKRSN